MAYESTDVGVEKSQGAIRNLLYAHGARNFAFSEAEHDGQAWAAVDFVHDDQRVRMRVPVKAVDPKWLAEKVRRAQSRTRQQIEREALDQEAKRIWRVVFHGLKARLVSVQEGVETFEEAFLSHLVDPVTGMTMWEAVKGAVENGALRSGGPGLMSEPLLALAAGADDGIIDAEVVG